MKSTVKAAAKAHVQHIALQQTHRLALARLAADLSRDSQQQQFKVRRLATLPLQDVTSPPRDEPTHPALPGSRAVPSSWRGRQQAAVQESDLWEAVRRSRTAQQTVARELRRALSSGVLSTGALPNERVRPQGCMQGGKASAMPAGPRKHIQHSCRLWLSPHTGAETS